MQEDINYILSFLPSEVYTNANVKERLINVMGQLGQPINRGCPDCYNRAYFKLKRLKQNNYFINNISMYLFRKDLHSYRSKKTGKALTNNNSSIEERKEVYNTSVSHRALFDLETIPTVKKVTQNTTSKSYENNTPKASNNTTTTKSKRTRKKATTTTKK